MSGFLMMLKLHDVSAKLLSTPGNKINLLTVILYMITSVKTQRLSFGST